MWLADQHDERQDADDNKTIAAEWKIDRPILTDATGQVGKPTARRRRRTCTSSTRTASSPTWARIDNDDRGNKADKRPTTSTRPLDEVLAGKPVSEPQTKPYGCSVKYASK